MGVVEADQDIKTIREHLTELRKRLFVVAIVFGIGAGVGFIYNQKIIAWLVQPLGQTLYFSNPSGGLDFIFSICCIAGLLLALPVIMYEIVEFIRPAHKGLQSLRPIRIVLLATFCAVMGVAYAYFVGIPAALHFLINFAGQDVKPLLNASSYMNFVIAYLAGAALVFQIPLFIAIRNKISPLKPGGLSKLQQPIILIAVIGAGIITPTPDPFNQMMLALPLILLFEVTALFFWQRRLSRERKDRRRAARIKTAAQVPSPVLHSNPVPLSAVTESAQVLPLALQQNHHAPQHVVTIHALGEQIATLLPAIPSSESIKRVRPVVLHTMSQNNQSSQSQ